MIPLKLFGLCNYYGVKS